MVNTVQNTRSPFPLPGKEHTFSQLNEIVSGLLNLIEFIAELLWSAGLAWGGGLHM
jgi:hypothetical protein